MRLRRYRLLLGDSRLRGGVCAQHAHGSAQQDNDGDEGEGLLF